MCRPDPVGLNGDRVRSAVKQANRATHGVRAARQCGGDGVGRIKTHCGCRNPAAAGGEPVHKDTSGFLEPYIAIMTTEVYTQALRRTMEPFLAPLLTSPDPHL